MYTFVRETLSLPQAPILIVSCYSCVCVCVCVCQEEEVVSVLTSALQQCLVLGSRDHHEWNTQMLDALIER